MLTFVCDYCNEKFDVKLEKKFNPPVLCYYKNVHMIPLVRFDYCDDCQKKIKQAKENGQKLPKTEDTLLDNS